VHLVNGRLRLLEREPDRLFQEAAAAAARDPVELRSKAVALPIAAAEKQGFILHMLPLDRNRRASLGADRDAALLVIVRRLDGAGAANLAAFAKRFGLTRQEARVLGAIVGTGSVPMAADLLGISTTTARTHLNHLFSKTGVHSQAGLVRLLIEGESPFKDS
jgi:DNA-binding CsgD family transcriptional regulator